MKLTHLRFGFAAALLCGLAAACPTSAGAAEQSEACIALERRFDAEKAVLERPQVNAILFQAADNDCASLITRLLSSATFIAVQDRLGGTALTHAARSGKLTALKLLLENGADINHRMIDGSTPLFVALDKNRPEAARELLAHGADAKLTGRSDVTPLAAAAFNGDAEVAAALMSRGADPKALDATGKAPIVYAAAAGHLPVVSLLLGTRLDVNAKYGNALTALMWAAGHADDVPEADGLSVVTLLLDKGAALEDADDRGRTALMIAAEQGHTAIAELLIARGAAADKRDHGGLRAADLTNSTELREKLAQSAAR
jgi:ankyrin repeat protein